MKVITPRNVLLVFLAGLLAGILYRPASIIVGSERIALKESVGKVFVLNAIGDFRGYGRCELTGLSWYWAPLNSLQYDATNGVIVSQYGVEALRRMKETDACKIAQAAFDRVQEKYHWEANHERGLKLICPLKPMWNWDEFRVEAGK